VSVVSVNGAGADTTPAGTSTPILVVDDRSAKRLAIRSILESLGHEIVEVESGQDALRELMERTFAVILMDVEMPGMDGYDTSKLIRLRRDCEQTPIIFVTAHGPDETQLPQAYASGAVDFIFAPIVPEILRAKVRIFVDLYRKSQEVEEARALAIDASHAKSEFVANMSHELRTPLNGVIGITNLLRRTALDSTQSDYVDALVASGEALLAVIGEVLDFSKIEAGHLELDRIDFNVREAVEAACYILAEQAHAKGLEISHWVDADVPTMVHGDRARLRQILLNLLGNAVKFTAAGEVSLRVARHGTDELSFSVSDTGVGIDKDQATHLFEAFVQADQSTSRQYGGTGLGLTISSQLVKAMGGEIVADRRDVGGSVFWFTASLPEVAAATESAERHPELRGMRALIVDDNATNREILAHYLESWGIDHTAVAEAADAIDALDQAEQAARPFELVVVDVNLPALGGMDLVRAMRERPTPPTTKVLVLSSSAVEPGSFTDSGVGAVLAKPSGQRTMHDAIAAVITGVSARIEPLRADAVHPDRGLKILIADDNEINSMLTGELLAQFGLQTAIAHGGLEAVEMAGLKGYAAILMDCQMPGIDGFEATRRIRLAENGHRVPIIAMTALTMPGDEQRCLDAGMDAYVSKPVLSNELDLALQRWLPV
jgi:CheY-like chemotaxis protein